MIKTGFRVSVFHYKIGLDAVHSADGMDAKILFTLSTNDVYSHRLIASLCACSITPMNAYNF